MNEEQMIEKSRSKGTTAQFLMSVVAIALGALLLFVPALQIATICYLFCGALMVAGIVSALTFFLSGDHRRVEGYGFALGVLLLLLGICGLLRAQELTGHFDVFLTMLALVLGVLILQGTVQIFLLKNRLWILNLILTVVSIGGAVLGLADIRIVTQRIVGFSYWVLMIVGAASLISLMLTVIVVWYDRRKTQRQKTRAQENSAEQEKQGVDTLLQSGRDALSGK